jgi:hypothetical protein
MNINTLLSCLALILVAGFFVMNTGSSNPSGNKNISYDSKMKDGMGFQSGITTFTKKKYDYTIFTADYGVHWWAVKKTEDKWHIVGTAEEVYPGLLKNLNDPIHAELALMEYQKKREKR